MVFMRPILQDFHNLSGSIILGTKDSLLKIRRAMIDAAADETCLELTTETLSYAPPKLAWFCSR